MDNAAERVWLVDENGAAIPPETTLLLLVRELAASERSGGTARPDHRDAHGGGDRRRKRLGVRRTKASQGDLLATAATGDVVFAGASGGGYVFPEFLPAYDAVMSIGKILELIAHAGGGKVSDLVARPAASARSSTSRRRARGRRRGPRCAR